MIIITIRILFILILLTTATSSLSAQTKVHAGWLEKIQLLPEKAEIIAKLDTGAESCSLHASDIKEFKKGKEKWVRFTITDRFDKPHVIEQKVARQVRIKIHGRPSQIRKVIRLGFCLHDKYTVSDTSLVDRTNFNYQLLLGRSFLAGHAVVDPAVSFTEEPECTVKK